MELTEQKENQTDEPPVGSKVPVGTAWKVWGVISILIGAVVAFASIAEIAQPVGTLAVGLIAGGVSMIWMGQVLRLLAEIREAVGKT